MDASQVPPKMLLSKAAEVRSLKKSYDGTIRDINELILDMESQWNGVSQDFFVEEYKFMRPKLHNFSKMLDSYAKLMEAAAREIQGVDDYLDKQEKHTEEASDKFLFF